MFQFRVIVLGSLMAAGCAANGCEGASPTPINSLGQPTQRQASTQSASQAISTQPATTQPATTQSATTQPATTQPAQARKTFLMHYLSWYQTPAVRGHWGSHWTGPGSKHNPSKTGPDGLPDVWSHLHPLIGPYDSADPDVLECHLLQMKLAGVDGVIVDWYGISKTADYPSVHEAAKAMFASAGRLGMKFAVCFEDRTIKLMIERSDLKTEQVPAHLTDTVQWMRDNWFKEPQYFRFDGRPLLLDFGPVFVMDAAVWNQALGAGPDRPRFFALHHLWKKVCADGGFTWVHKDVWSADPDQATIQRRLHDVFSQPSKDTNQVIISAWPGFKDVYEKSYPSIEYRDGKTMEETLAAGMSGPWSVIQLVTWNDYGEGTCIEPTSEFGYRFLESVQQARRTEPGVGFANAPADLRLPARLFALRKSGKCEKGRLDRISALLSAGACGEASRLLDAESASIR